MISSSATQKSIVSNNFKPIDLNTWSDSAVDHLTKSISSTGDIAEYLERSKRPVILVDTSFSGSHNSLVQPQSYPLLLDQNISIVSANKSPFSDHEGLWNSLLKKKASSSKRGHVGYSAAVASGLPVTGILNEMLHCGDTVRTIKAVVCSPLSYIFNQYSKPPAIPTSTNLNDSNESRLSFSETIQLAIENGYVAEDPREILTGLDTAEQMTILARTAGLKVPNLTSFPVRNLIPKPLREVETVEDLIEKLPKYDNTLEKLRKKAEEDGKVIRYVGSIKMSEKSSSIDVGIER